jgi:hypothetical protein
MTEKSNKCRKSIKMANEMNLENSQTVIVTGAVHEICKNIFSDTVKTLTYAETKVIFQDTFSNMSRVVSVKW